MNLPTDDLPVDDLDLARLLADRAGSIDPHGSSASSLARRATRIRHRRRAAVAGVGLSTGAVVAALVVTRPMPDPPSQLFADGGGVATSAPEPAPPPTALTFTPFVHRVDTPSSPIPRLGLDLPGGSVTAGVDSPAVTDGSVPPPAVSVRFTDAAGSRFINVMVTFAPNWEDDQGSMIPVPGEPVELGDGVTGTLRRIPDTMPGAGTSLSIKGDSASLLVSGQGATDEELIEVAKGLEVTAAPELLVRWLPSDLHTGEVLDPMVWSPGPQSALYYWYADGRSASIMASYTPSPGRFDTDLERVAAAPSDGEFVREVRGHDAIVRKTAGMTSIVWREPGGYLIEMYVNLATDPGAIVDEGIVDSVVDLDDATFQALRASAHPT